MDSAFRTKIPRSDPDRWKPLYKLVLAIVMIAPLASLEYLLVSGMIRSGSLRGIIPAILYGVILFVLLYALAVGAWRWLNRPPAEQIIEQAHEVLDHQLATTVIALSKSETPPNKVIYAALPVTFLLLALFGAIFDRWVMFFSMLIGASVLGGAMYFVFSRERHALSQTLVIDPALKTFRFEHFQFVSGFLPERPRDREEVGFDQILGVDFTQSGNGPAMLLIRTTKGTVTVTGHLTNFEQVHAIVVSLVALNKSDREKYQEHLNAEPEIKTPWYGWLILLVVIGAIVLVGWKFMYSEY